MKWINARGNAPAEEALDDAVWYCTDLPEAVAQKAPNVWGLYDMHGNMGEWAWDRYHTFYGGEFQLRPYVVDAAVDPLGARADVRRWGNDGQHRVIRGGSYEQRAARCRSASRRRAQAEGDPFEFHQYGVRPVRTLPR